MYTDYIFINQLSYHVVQDEFEADVCGFPPEPSCDWGEHLGTGWPVEPCDSVDVHQTWCHGGNYNRVTGTFAVWQLRICSRSDTYGSGGKSMEI